MKNNLICTHPYQGCDDSPTAKPYCLSCGKKVGKTKNDKPLKTISMDDRYIPDGWIESLVSDQKIGGVFLVCISGKDNDEVNHKATEIKNFVTELRSGVSRVSKRSFESGVDFTLKKVKSTIQKMIDEDGIMDNYREGHDAALEKLELTISMELEHLIKGGDKK